MPSCIQQLDTKARNLIARAVKALEESAVYRAESMNSPESVRQYLTLKLAHLEREEFMAIWLDAQNRVIDFDVLFVGTLTCTSVYPREVIKRALALNAGAVVIAHNHPSGHPEPSVADLDLTRVLKSALAMVDVKLLDHFIVAGTAPPTSLAERGQV